MARNDTYRKVKEEMEDRRRNAYAVAEARNAELRALSPRIRAIDDELTKTGLLLFKAACAGEDIEPIRTRNAELCKERALELKLLGYPGNYTEPEFTCTDCSDTGFVGTAMCKCLREAVIRENIKGMTEEKQKSLEPSQTYSVVEFFGGKGQRGRRQSQRNAVSVESGIHPAVSFVKQIESPFAGV